MQQIILPLWRSENRCNPIVVMVPFKEKEKKKEVGSCNLTIRTYSCQTERFCAKMSMRAPNQGNRPTCKDSLYKKNRLDSRINLFFVTVSRKSEAVSV